MISISPNTPPEAIADQLRRISSSIISIYINNIDDSLLDVSAISTTLQQVSFTIDTVHLNGNRADNTYRSFNTMIELLKALPPHIIRIKLSANVFSWLNLANIPVFFNKLPSNITQVITPLTLAGNTNLMTDEAIKRAFLSNLSSHIVSLKLTDQVKHFALTDANTLSEYIQLLTTINELSFGFIIPKQLSALSYLPYNIKSLSFSYNPQAITLQAIDSALPMSLAVITLKPTLYGKFTYKRRELKILAIKEQWITELRTAEMALNNDAYASPINELINIIDMNSYNMDSDGIQAWARQYHGLLTPSKAKRTFLTFRAKKGSEASVKSDLNKLVSSISQEAIQYRNLDTEKIAIKRA